jgi:hypothetical protein
MIYWLFRLYIIAVIAGGALFLLMSIHSLGLAQYEWVDAGITGENKSGDLVWTDTWSLITSGVTEYIPQLWYLDNGEVWAPSMSTGFDLEEKEREPIDGKECNWLPTILQPYDIVFDSFSTDEVFSGSLIKSWNIEQGKAMYFTPTRAKDPDLFLVVFDPCGKIWRHADVLLSDLLDTNTQNNILAPALSCDSIAISQTKQVHFLSWTESTNQIIAHEYNNLSASQAIQLLEKIQMTPDAIWTGRFGVQPSYIIYIPQYQQTDTYEGTITWTLMY